MNALANAAANSSAYIRRVITNDELTTMKEDPSNAYNGKHSGFTIANNIDDYHYAFNNEDNQNDFNADWAGLSALFDHFKKYIPTASFQALQTDYQHVLTDKTLEDKGSDAAQLADNFSDALSNAFKDYQVATGTTTPTNSGPTTPANPAASSSAGSSSSNSTGSNSSSTQPTAKPVATHYAVPAGNQLYIRRVNLETHEYTQLLLPETRNSAYIKKTYRAWTHNKAGIIKHNDTSAFVKTMYRYWRPTGSKTKANQLTGVTKAIKNNVQSTSAKTRAKQGQITYNQGKQALLKAYKYRNRQNILISVSYYHRGSRPHISIRHWNGYVSANSHYHVIKSYFVPLYYHAY